MTTRIAPLLLALLAAVLHPYPATAQTDPAADAQRIAELEEENHRLRQELAELRLELAQLRRAMEAQAGAENMPSGEAELGEDGGADDAVGEAAESEEEVQVFGSADEVYRAIPQELRPGRDGWDIVQRPAVADWLKENIPGSRFEARLEVDRTTITYNQTTEDWTVTLYFAHKPMRYMNWGMEQRVSRVALRGDRDFANRARRLESGARVNVSAIITATSWGMVLPQGVDEIWKPEHCELRLEDAEVRSPHLRQ